MMILGTFFPYFVHRRDAEDAEGKADVPSGVMLVRPKDATTKLATHSYFFRQRRTDGFDLSR
jgi:hypothetical protein